MLAEGDCGFMKLDSAITVATKNATVVKNPKTFCTRFTVECILKEGLWLWGGVVGEHRCSDDVSCLELASALRGR